MVKKLKQPILALIIMVVSIFICGGQYVQAQEDIKLLGQPSATLTRMKEWARSKKATEEFVSLADIYWNLSTKHGGINPVVAYAQAAYETGYGKFGGVLNASYYNPCGLKTSSGGGDKDADAHKRFSSWEEGISAHLDHMALYAGVSGYPRKNTADPRHFSWLLGKSGDSVYKLGLSWATNSSYSNKLISLIKEIEKSSKLPQKGEIDSSIQSIDRDKKATIKGWALNNEGVSKVKVYINNIFVGDAQYGLPTPQLLNQYSMYKNNANAGYSIIFDPKDIPIGQHTLKVEIIGKDGERTILTKVISVTGKIEEDKPDASIPNKKQGIVKVSSALNVRSGAGTNYAVIGTLAGNSKVSIEAESGSWYKINFNGVPGWVSKQYITILSDIPESKPEENPPAVPSPTEKVGIIKVSSSLNLRNGAGTNYSVIGSLKKNESVVILGEENSWYKIRTATGKIGYCSKEYVVVQNNTQPNPPTQTPNYKNAVVYNISTNLRVRTAANTSSNVVGYLLNGEKVQIKGTNNGWHNVRFVKNGVTKEGYVSAQYIKII